MREKIKADIEKAVGKIAPKWHGRVEVSRPQDGQFGDFSTNAAFEISRELKQPSPESARVLAQSLQDLPYIQKLEVKGAGFLNFFIKEEVWQKEVQEVLDKGDKYGSNEFGKGNKARVEFVSANPTGPLHFGNARGGPIGDALASVLAFSGYSVIREYLHNDVGTQVEKLGESIVSVQKGKKVTDQEYKGEYVADLAREIGKAESAKEAGEKAVKIMLEEIIKDCGEMGIKFDEVYPESGFMEKGQTKAALEKIKKFLKKQEDATWFAPKDEFLKDRETVVVKSDGAYTYFANDIAYHNLKFSSGADLVIDVLGANHHGHVPRLKAAVSALGYDASNFHVILYQWVRFKRGGEVVKMSKRAGTFITAKEVLSEVGKDAVRFFILSHDANSPIDFDLELAKEKSAKNPVYYVQYAHARIASIIAKSDSRQGEADYSLLSMPFELSLIKEITKLPELVEDISQNFAVHRLTGYSRELADTFHKFYENCPVISSDKKLMSARLGLVKAAKITLANTLALLGITAPDKM